MADRTKERKLQTVAPDLAERSRALNVDSSFLVQAPAGSGKTYLLTQRFLKLLARVEDPREIVAITFTRAAAAEMRQRILGEMEKAERAEAQPAKNDAQNEDDSLAQLAQAALDHGRSRGWGLPEQTGWLRVTTIDAFCRSLAAQCPLDWGALNALGGRLEPAEHPEELYRVAARRTLNALSERDTATGHAVAALLAWRDNAWQDVERLLMKMLADRNRWFQDFVFDREPDWRALRARLEAPFEKAARHRLKRVDELFARLDGSLEYALELARLACNDLGKDSPVGLAERAEFLLLPFSDLADAQSAYSELARFLLTNEGGWRKPGGLNKNNGFPATDAGRSGKARFGEFVEGLSLEPGLREALGGFLEPLPMAYSAAEWELLQQCFVVLRRAAAELQVVFTESGRVDYTEVAQIALDVLQAPDGSPSDFAMQFAGGIRHLLVDEFQDTSRKQFELIDRIVAAWPEREGRSCFCVGDPMQSIYGFRESEVELFERPARRGFAAEAGPFPDAEPLMLERVKLLANFRTEPTLVRDLNERFAAVFSESSSRQTSAVNFTAAVPALASKGAVSAQLHVAFSRTRKKGETGTADTEQVSGQQMEQIVALIREHARRAGEYRQAAETEDAKKYRIAVLARKRKTLERIAAALDEAGIAYRATALVPLGERMEILDALSLARAAFDPLDRTAWLSVLRGPWCGLTLSELYRLTSADDGAVKAKSVPELIAERLPELAASGFDASRVTAIEQTAEAIRIAAVQSSASSGPGTWLFDLWRTVGGERATNAVEKENLRLLWASLDALPNGEMDLLDRNEDSGLRVALDKLTAVPNPAASADFGVQLMTIHAAKGLEFEVVMVPELEAANRQTEQRMLAWLERGVEDAETPHLTEFLIAPIQRKGEEKGSAKAWVEGVMQERETDEMRRLLYVAATRAREELHLFTRAEYSVSEKDGARVKTPGRSLLASAWPGFAAEIEAAFTAFVAANEAEQASAAQAPAETNTSSKQAIPVFSLRRLRASTQAVEEKRRRGGTRLDVAPEAPLYRRSEGGLRVRVEGIAAHRLLQRLSWLRLRMDAHQAVAALSVAVPGLVAEMRSQGLSLAEAREIADWALAVAQRAGSDPTGAWIVAPHRQATSEAAWTGLITMPDGEEQLKTLRPDRCFLAGVEPLQPEEQSETTWWIIDYKTSGGELASGSEEQVATFVAEHRARFAGQLEAYAGLLRKLVAGDGVAPPSIRLGLYYPRLLRLDYWRG